MEKIIDAETIQQLKAKFIQEMKNPVDVILFTNLIILPGQEEIQQINNFARQILKELSEIEPRIIVKELPVTHKSAKELGIITSPSIAIGYELGYKIIFNGAPLGHEATPLIELIILVSSAESHLENGSKELLKNISKDVHLQVFTTPTCPYCPLTVIQAGQIAIVLKGRVKAEFVESAENQQLAAKFNISSVPQIIINGIFESSGVGAMPEINFVKHILKFAGNEDYKAKLREEEQIKREKEKLPDNPNEIIYITDNNIKEAINKYKNLVVDFWAEWCAPCKMIAPIVEQLANENAGKIVFGKLNVDENSRTVSAYEVMSIPMLVVFKNGDKIGEIQGAMSKTDIERQINNLLAGDK